MSNLALYAAPFDSDSTNDISDANPAGHASHASHASTIQNKTIKNRGRASSNTKVQSMMDQIHKSTVAGDSSELGDFNPPDHPTSVGAERKKGREPDSSVNYELPPTNINDINDTDQRNTQDTQQDTNREETDYPIDDNAYKELPNTISEDYYKNSGPMYGVQNSHQDLSNRDELTKRLDYMIHLLEEQQDERTGHITEELILYSFLGVFIIFIVDSFARSGKYIR